MKLPKIAFAGIALTVAIGEELWVHSHLGTGVPDGAVAVYALAVAAFTIAIIPGRAWTHAVVLGCLVVAWPAAFLAADTAVRCGGTPAIDVFTSLYFAPMFALLVAIWMPIPFAAATLIAGGSIGFHRLVPRPLPGWSVAAAIASIPIAAQLFAWSLGMQGMNQPSVPNACPFTM